MKILHIISQDSGGAGRAAFRLHLALLEFSKNYPNEAIESIMLVQNKSSDLQSVIRLASSKYQKIIEKIRPHLSCLPLLLYPKRHKDIFSTDFIHNPRLIKTINKLEPDIVHLHWINNGFLNIKDLLKIKAPLIWSLHDANPYTGGCHVIEAHCDKEKTHCQKCPLLQSKFKFDLSFFTFRQKAKTYAKLNITINGLSRWIADCAKNSALLKDKKIINLPNPIDTKLYCPIDKNIARNLLNLDKPKKIIAFGAIDATSIDRKGYPQLKEALKLLKNKQNLKIIIFGASSDKNGKTENIEGIQTQYLGHLHDDISLKLIYNVADVLVTPSLSESFGQIASESLACGTPVVCFETSGLKDIVEHKINGYLAKPFEPQDLANGIEWVLKLAPKDYQILAKNAREKSTQNFSSSLVVQRYIENYKEILQGGGGIEFYEEIIQILSNIKNNQKIIAFGAIDATSIDRKGYPQLKEALKLLKNKQNLKIIIFGSSSDKNGKTENIEGIQTQYLGHLHDDISLKLIYNVADVLVTPSLSENLSNLIMESLACGTPVVAFDIGGNSDMISHKINGYLAKPFEAQDLIKGIEWVLRLDFKNYQILAKNARKKVLQNFDSSLVAQKYIEIYKESLMGGGAGKYLVFYILCNFYFYLLYLELYSRFFTKRSNR